jgi:hypothetical protein
MASMFYNCHSLISLKIEELNLSNLKNTDNMFFSCSSLKYLNLSNFYSNITTAAGMFSNCNKNLIYCIDDKKEYRILSELKNYRKSCSDMCTKYYSKKYIKESNSCIDSCSTEIIYKYDFNNTCLENCPNDTILANDNVSCILIEDNEKNTTNNTTNNNTTNNNSTNNDTTNNNTTNNNTTNNNTTNNNTSNNDTSNNDTFNNNTINNNTSINNTSNNNKDNTNNSNEKKNFIIIISIVGGVLILTVIIFFIVRICRKRAINNNNNNETLLEYKSRKKK